MSKMAKATMHYAQSVHQCWLIARNDTERYQNHVNRNVARGKFVDAALCKAARDAADRIALTIRYGRKQGRRSRRRK